MVHIPGEISKIVVRADLLCARVRAKDALFLSVHPVSSDPDLKVKEVDFFVGGHFMTIHSLVDRGGWTKKIKASTASAGHYLVQRRLLSETTSIFAWFFTRTAVVWGWYKVGTLHFRRRLSRSGNERFLGPNERYACVDTILNCLYSSQTVAKR